MKYLKRFDEKKDVKETEQKQGFDSKSLEDDAIGFKSELEELSDRDEKKIKKEIQVVTPGLNKSIKKFEDFEIEFDIFEDEPAYSGCGCCDYCSGDSDCECGCPECDCVPEHGCDGCDCVPCKCK
jgi:hypothetical protein